MMSRIPRWSPLLLVAALLASSPTGSALAQGGMSRPGAAPGGGGALFGGKPKPVVHGPSLATTDELVSEIRVEGNRTVPDDRIVAQMSTRVGRPFDPMALSRDVMKLASMPWFVDVKTFSESNDKGRVIILRVKERATNRYVQYLGNARISDKNLAKETGLKEGAAMDPYAVEDGRRKIEELYKSKGFSRAQVSVLEGDKPDDKGVTYVVNEGVKQRIWAVRFEGNNSDFASDRRLNTKIKSKPGVGFYFGFGGKLKRDQIDSDVRALQDYYREFGFYDAKVGRVLEFNDEGTWVTIRFVIHEGPRYMVRSVRFVGNERFASDALRAGMKLPTGAPFERAKLQADVQWLTEVYGSHGYVFANIKPEPVFLEEPGQLDLVYRIDEGQKWRVGRIFVHIGGDNPHTRIQTALNRLSIRPGEVMDIRELKASERRLQASQLFLSEPARGIMPKITYRIPELENTDFAASGGNPRFRGQSPAEKPSPWRRVHEAFKPGAQPAASGAVDVHLVLNQAEEGEVFQMAPAESPQGPQPHTVRKPPAYEGVYQQPLAWRSPSLPVNPRSTISASHHRAAYAPVAAPQPIFRGQSPPPSVYGQYQPQATAPLPPNAYGGTAPRAVSPSSAPAGYTAHASSAAPADYVGPPPAGQAGAVQQTQFGQPFPTSPPPAGSPNPAVVGAPYVDPNDGVPVYTVPPNSQLFPGGPYGAPGYGYPDDAVDVMVNVQEAQTGRFMIGVGVNSDAGVVGQILIEENNFDWRQIPTSWRDVYEGRAFRGGGQRFRIEAAPGTEVQRYLVNWQEPFLMDTPISLGLSGSYFDRRFTHWDEQRLGGRVTTGYGWTGNDLSAGLSYRYENIKVFDATAGVPELDEVIGQGNNLHGFGLTLTNDTRNNPFLPTEGHFIRLQLEQVVGTFDYPRAILDARQYYLVKERPDHSGRHVLATSSRLGFTGGNTPIYEHFFAGGYSTLRGFDFRGASPTRFVSGSNVEIGGEFMWVNTLEYMFPLTADDMVNGVVFCDFGTVESSVKIDDFRVAPGVGLRLTIPAMGPAPIALDFAWPIAHADADDRQVFTFNVGFLR